MMQQQSCQHRVDPDVMRLVTVLGLTLIDLMIGVDLLHRIWTR